MHEAGKRSAVWLMHACIVAVSGRISVQEEAAQQQQRAAERRKAAEEAAASRAAPPRLRARPVPLAERYVPRPATPPPQELSPERSATPSPSPTKVTTRLGCLQ